MKQAELEPALYVLLRAADGQALDAYQLSNELHAQYRELSDAFAAEYAGRAYSLASFIANTLRQCAKRDHHIVQEGEQRNGKWSWQE